MYYKGKPMKTSSKAFIISNFFQGKYNQNVLKNNAAAFGCYKSALDNAASVPELQLMIVYELGTMHLATTICRIA